MPRLTTPLLRVTPVSGDHGDGLALHGELDLATVPVLMESLDACERDDESVVALDLTGLSFLDASGLKAILNAHRRAIRRHERGLVLVNPSRDIRRLLELTAIDLTIEVVGEAPAAAAL
jgi:anti-sigma B factor antagonist